MKVSMLRSRFGVIAIGGVGLVIAFAGGAFWNGATGEAQPPTTLQTNSIDEAAVADPAAADAEAAVADAQRDFDRAMADLDSPYATRTRVPDAETQRIERQALEASELMCRQYGQSCELARMHRRHYNETYGGR